jgi:hypothetical protein
VDRLVAWRQWPEHIEALRDVERKALDHQATERVMDVPLSFGGLASGRRETPGHRRSDKFWHGAGQLQWK